MLDSVPLRNLKFARDARLNNLTHDVRNCGDDRERCGQRMSGGANGHWNPIERVAAPATFTDEIARTG